VVGPAVECLDRPRERRERRHRQRSVRHDHSWAEYLDCAVDVLEVARHEYKRATTCLSETPNPLPSVLPACTVVLDRSTFGKDEVDALLHLGNPANIDSALYVVVDGFTPTQLGVTAVSLSGTPNVAPTINFSGAIAGMMLTATSLVLRACRDRLTLTVCVDGHRKAHTVRA
jgi:hypothetical protein